MVRLSLILLGGFEAAVNGRPVTGFQTDKVRALLAYLGLEADRPHPRPVLAALLWPEMADDVALRNLRKSVHRLREALDGAAPGLGDALLDVDRQSLALRSAALDLDVAAFRREAAGCPAHPGPRPAECEACLASLGAAAERYRDDLLAGFALGDAPEFEEWLAVRREDLRQAALALLAALAEAEERRGRPGLAAEHATRQLRLEPWSEPAYRQIIRALAQAGRRTEALARYEACRQLLAAELGVAPEPQTTALAELVRAGGVPAPPVARTVPLRHLPRTEPPFVGREAELQLLDGLLREPSSRLVSLVGPGGVGKTRLAVEAVRRLAQPGEDSGLESIAFVALAGTTEPDHVPAALAAALGLAFQAGTAPERQLADFLAERRDLLVLDNFEHLTASAGLLGSLLDAAPGLRLLLTSRQPVHLRAERLLRLDGLAFPAGEDADAAALGTAAVRLYLQAAQHFQPGQGHGPEDLAAIARTCRIVEGLPLAIEIAAAAERGRSAAAIAEALERGLATVQSPFADTPERHRSLAAVLDHSWALLSLAERATWAQTAVFQGPFTAEAAAAVTGDPGRALARLVDQSLVRLERAGRYGLHGLARRYAESRLVGLALEGPARERHAAFHLGQLAAAEPALYGGQPLAAVQALQPMLDDLRLAWRWAAEHGAVALLAGALPSLDRYYMLTGLQAEAAASLAQAAAALTDSADLSSPEAAALLARLQLRRSRWHYRLGATEASRRASEAARQLADAEGLRVEAGEARGELAMLALMAGEAEACRGLLVEATALLAGTEVPEARATLEGHWLQYYLRTERPAEGLVHAEEHLRLRRAAGDQVGELLASSDLAIVHHIVGDFDSALSMTGHVVEVARSLGLTSLMATTLGNRGFLLFELGDDAAATACLEEALRLHRQLGHQLAIARHRQNLARVQRREGRLAEALASFDDALVRLAGLGAKSFHDSLLTDKAELLLALGDVAGARSLNEAGLAAMRAAGNHEHVLEGELLAARIEQASGEPEAARARLHGLLAMAEAPGERAEVHAALWRLDGDEVDRLAAIGGYEAAYAERPRHDYRLRREALERGADRPAGHVGEAHTGDGQ